MFYVKQNSDGTYSVTNDTPDDYLLSGEGLLPDCFDDALAALNAHLIENGVNKPLTLKPE